MTPKLASPVLGRSLPDFWEVLLPEDLRLVFLGEPLLSPLALSPFSVLSPVFGVVVPGVVVPGLLGWAITRVAEPTYSLL